LKERKKMDFRNFMRYGDKSAPEVAFHEKSELIY